MPCKIYPKCQVQVSLPLHTAAVVVDALLLRVLRHRAGSVHTRVIYEDVTPRGGTRSKDRITPWFSTILFLLFLKSQQHEDRAHLLQNRSLFLAVGI